MTTARVAVLGAGSLGRAVLAGLSATGRYDLAGTTRSRAAAAAAEAASPGVAVVALEDEAAANRRLAAQADVVVVAVKPAGTTSLLAEIAPVLRPDAIVLSTAAGITVAALEQAVDGAAPVLRTMTNLPVGVGQGVTAVARSARADDTTVRRGLGVFAGTGLVLSVDEDQIDAFTAVAGSGPGLVYWLIEKFALEFEAAGLTSADALRAASTTFAAALAHPASADVPLTRDTGEGAILASALRAAADRSSEIGGRHH